MACAAVVVDDDVGGARADLDEAYTELDLLLRENALAGREPCADDIFDVEAGAVHGLDDVLDRGLGAGDDVGLHLEPVAGHADCVLYAILAIDGVGAGDDVDDLAVAGDADRLAGLHHTLNVVVADLVVGVGHGDHAGGVLAPEVGATEGDDDRLDALAGHALRGHHRGLDGVDGLLEVDNHAFAQAFGRAFPNAEDAHGSSWLVRLCDDHGDPGCAQVETDGFLPSRQRVLERLLERGDGRLAGCGDYIGSGVIAGLDFVGRGGRRSRRCGWRTDAMSGDTVTSFRLGRGCGCDVWVATRDVRGGSFKYLGA